ncbi:MAG: group II intron reverse transcriptase/maturase, partial [Flavobacteriales bacterium]|nr:group II intron reverse transcriptase/maturase [Flavobacteriales bacterium]
MIERIVAKPNMLKACRQVVSNKGVAGVDGLGVAALAKHLAVHGERLATELQSGQYEPQAILGVAIPKSKGGTRLLGVPTVV